MREARFKIFADPRLRIGGTAIPENMAVAHRTKIGLPNHFVWLRSL
ncbi:hypothetical protein CHELA1G11_13716 [Hyphomicrobiales bacterium]|nr:hypothetical protein CHELA1G2_10598 [Hyphomicrobiales bacterium]CAH1673541.1 hypothetical protein CHELA1G11_13716 [Hyphomicrobiales bacterium]